MREATGKRSPDNDDDGEEERTILVRREGGGSREHGEGAEGRVRIQARRGEKKRGVRASRRFRARARETNGSGTAGRRTRNKHTHV